MHIPDQFITVYEAAERLGYSSKHVAHRIRQGDLPSAIKGAHNAWWVDPIDVENFIVRKGRTFWEKIDKAGPGGCWLWTGRTHKGYGTHPRIGLAHRFTYEQLVGPIPVGMEIDHLCRNTMCCNPAHLEPVTRAENMRRQSTAQTHCKHGHEFTPENTYKRNGHRSCRACTAAAQRRYQERQRAS